VSVQTLTNGLLAYWPLNSSGTRADSTGNGEAMLQSGVISTVPGFGNFPSVSLWPGTNGNYLATASGLWLPTGSFTLAAWVNIVPASGLQEYSLMSSLSSTGNGSGFELYAQTLNNPPNFQANFNLLIYPSYNVDQYGYVVTPNVNYLAGYYFVVCTYNSTTKDMAISVNGSTPTGTAFSKGSQNPSGYTQSGQPVNLGEPLTDPGGTTLLAYSGNMAGAGIWNRVLSQSEIVQLWNNGNGLVYPFFPSIQPAKSLIQGQGQSGGYLIPPQYGWVNRGTDAPGLLDHLHEQHQAWLAQEAERDELMELISLLGTAGEL
jgi:hypothetical protein